ncbi:DNA-binding transcriptional ArsR family regulator [Catenulispora sp. GP43]|uniref:helix-turn-helix domain-containing protein n=1 Tax=Catenulispora sp. GP43 TaxID=3156263 RepID=UPI00351263A1
MLIAATAGTLPPALRAPLRQTFATRRLDLLAALVRVDRDAGHYIPDFLTPLPPGFESRTAEELHAVATTPTWRIAGELNVAACGELANTVGRTLPRGLIETDEQQTAERLATELEQVWLHVLAPRWPRIRARLEADVADRLQTVGRQGFAAAIESLDPRIDWHDGAVRLHGRFEVEVREAAVTFLPSVFITGAATVIDPVPQRAVPGYDPEQPGPWPYPQRRPPMFVYPVAPRKPGTPAQAAREAELIGRTRARILAAVADPATTGEVAGRLRPSPSTVSYHVQILHRAGLVRRTRDVRRVLYQSTRGAG